MRLNGTKMDGCIKNMFWGHNRRKFFFCSFRVYEKRWEIHKSKTKDKSNFNCNLEMKKTHRNTVYNLFLVLTNQESPSGLSWLVIIY